MNAETSKSNPTLARDAISPFKAAAGQNKKGEFAADEVGARQSLVQLREITSRVLPTKLNCSPSELSKINTHIENEYFKTLEYKDKKMRGMYAVSPSTKLLYKQTYGDMLSDTQVEAVSQAFEKQARQDISKSIAFKTRERNSTRDPMTYTDEDYVWLRNDEARLKNQELRREKKDFMKNGLTLKNEEYIPARKDMSSPIHGIRVTQRIYAGETMIEELRPPPPYAPLDQHSPWRYFDYNKAVVDGSTFRKKRDENRKAHDSFAPSPRYHDTKFTGNNELPYDSYPVGSESGYATIERPRTTDPNLTSSRSRSPLKITWQSNRISNFDAIKKRNANASVVRDAVYIQEKPKYGAKFKYLENLKQEEYLKHQNQIKSNKMHFPRLNYFRPNSNTREGTLYYRKKIPSHFNDYNTHYREAIQIDYPHDAHGIARFHKKPLKSVDVFPPAKERERLKLLNATEAWCSKNKKYLCSRGILSLSPDYSVLNNKHMKWRAKLAGPAESPYIHGKFDVTIVLDKYPTLPPKIVFNTPIFHPSIQFGHDKELKLHWASGVAKFNHKLSLIAICEIVLHAMRLPETHYSPSAEKTRAMDAWEKNTMDKRAFFQEAAHNTRRYANADNMLQKELEANLQLMKNVLTNIAPVETEHLQGAYLHFSPVYNTVKYTQKRGIIGGHKVYLSPCILQEKRRAGKEKKHEMISGTNAWRGRLSKKKAPPTTRSPLFNHGSVWKPGKRMMYNGMVKEATIAKDRKQKPSSNILLGKSLTKKQLIKVTQKELESIYSSDSSEGSRSDTDHSDDESVLSSDNGYTSDVTNYNSNIHELYSAFRSEKQTEDGEIKTVTSARSDYSFSSDYSDITTSRSSSSEMIDTARTYNSQYTSSVGTIETSRSSQFSGYLTPRSSLQRGESIGTISLRSHERDFEITTASNHQAVKPNVLKRNPYGFNYHSVKSLHEIKANGAQPLHESDACGIPPDTNRTEPETNREKKEVDVNDLFRTKPRNIPNHKHKFRYPINV